MNFTIIDKSARQREDLDYTFVVFKANAADVFDMDRAMDFWLIVKTLIRGGVVKMIVDMHDLRFIDSQGIGVIINAAKLIRAGHGDLVMINIDENIQKIFRPLNFHKFIKMFDTEDEAMNYLRFAWRK